MGGILKKIFEVIGLLGLVCFSFFYTDKITTVVKNEDDILKQINEIKDQYKKEAIDAKIKDNTIIPGLSGYEIDVDKSYKKMKKINNFNYNLLVYKDIKPNLSVIKKYDKFIISGNQEKKEVAMLFLVKSNTNIDKVLNVINNYDINVNFFIDGVWFENNNDTINQLINQGHNIGNYGYNQNYESADITWMNMVVKKIANQENTYCYSNYDEKILNICNNNKSYTIAPSIIVKNNPYINIKNNIKNGSIISLEITDELIKELPLIIEYISSRDLEFITLNELLDE